MYQIKEQLKDGRVVLVGMVGDEGSAANQVAAFRRSGRDAWYVKE